MRSNRGVDGSRMLPLAPATCEAYSSTAPRDDASEAGVGLGAESRSSFLSSECSSSPTIDQPGMQRAKAANILPWSLHRQGTCLETKVGFRCWASTVDRRLKTEIPHWTWWSTQIQNEAFMSDLGVRHSFKMRLPYLTKADDIGSKWGSYA
jgi:hypothetical protein